MPVYCTNAVRIEFVFPQDCALESVLLHSCELLGIQMIHSVDTQQWSLGRTDVLCSIVCLMILFQ